MRVWNIAPKGRQKIMSAMREYEFDGMVEIIDLIGYRMLDEYKGTANFNVKLRGITGGNIDIEIPLSFDAFEDSIKEPVIVYHDGEALALSQGFFDRIFGNINIYHKVYPSRGWMETERFDENITALVVNPSNKYDTIMPTRYGSINKDYSEAFKRFLLCFAGSENTVLDAVNNDAVFYRDDGFEIGDALFRLLTAYLGQASADEITDIAEYVYRSKTSSVRDRIRAKAVELMKRGVKYQDIITRLSIMFESTVESGDIMGIVDNLLKYAYSKYGIAKYAQTPEIEEWWSEAEEIPELGELPPLEEVIPFMEEPVEEPVIEEPIIEVPEHYERIVFPTPYQLQQLIKLYRVIRFSYKKLNDEYTIREVEPHYLWITKKGNIIMISWDFTRNNWRAFDINRVRDVDVSYFADWMEMGEFMAMLENARAKGVEPPINYRDIYTPRGPWSENVVTKRLHHLKLRTGSILYDKIEIMENMFGGLL